MAIQVIDTLELATLEKTWNNFDVNNLIDRGTAALNSADTLYQVKEWMKTVTGMSVRNSCLDGTVSASDLITAYTDVVMASTGTWIVFNHTSGYQVMLSATSSAVVSMTVSPLGLFSTGTSSVNPVATAQSVAALTQNSSSRALWSGGASSDGKCFYVMGFALNTIRSFSGVFEGYLMDERANSSQYLHLYSSSSSVPIIVSAMNGASVTESAITPAGFAGNPASATSASYSNRYFAYEVGAGVSPAVHFSKIIDFYYGGSSLFLSGDTALSTLGDAEMITPGTGWFVPWQSGAILQKI